MSMRTRRLYYLQHNMDCNSKMDQQADSHFSFLIHCYDLHILIKESIVGALMTKRPGDDGCITLVECKKNNLSGPS